LRFLLIYLILQKSCAVAIQPKFRKWAARHGHHVCGGSEWWKEQRTLYCVTMERLFLGKILLLCTETKF